MERICFFSTIEVQEEDVFAYDFWASELQKKGHYITFVKPKKNIESFKNPNFKLEYISLGLFKVRRLASILKAHSTNIIVVSSANDLKIANQLRFYNRRIRIVLFLFGSESMNKKMPARALKRLNTDILVSSQHAKRYFITEYSEFIPDSRIKILRSGVSIIHNPKIQFSNNTVVLGRFLTNNIDKEFEVISFIVEKIRLKNLNFKFLVYTPEVTISRLQGLIDKHKLANYIKLMSNVDIESEYKFFNTIDIYMSSYSQKGCKGLYILKAMACKKPVIAYNIHETTELVINEQTGFLVDFQDIEAALPKINKLIQDKALRDKFGEGGYQRQQKLFMLEDRLKECEAYFMKLGYMTKVVTVDLSMLKNMYCGLGQVAKYTAKHLSKFSKDINFKFLLPSDKVGIFGNNVDYTISSYWKRYFKPLDIDLVHHITYQSSKFKPARRSKNILTIHDLNFIFEKSIRKQPKYLKRVNKNIKQAEVITYISNFSKDMVNRYINIPNHKQQIVIHNGVEIDTEKNVEKPNFLPNGDFLFSLGEVREKKNFHVLLDFILELNQPIYLIISGSTTDDYAKKLDDLIKEKGLEKSVFLTGIISEEDKIYLYRHCKAFVFPSLYEGFGIPIIEAMRFGKPVFTSTSTSIPEVGGDLVFYWKHFNPKYMVGVYEDKMRLYESIPDYAEKLKKYSNQFSWERNIKEYLSIYKKLLES